MHVLALFIGSLGETCTFPPLSNTVCNRAEVKTIRNRRCRKPTEYARLCWYQPRCSYSQLTAAAFPPVKGSRHRQSFSGAVCHSYKLSNVSLATTVVRRTFARVGQHWRWLFYKKSVLHSQVERAINIAKSNGSSPCDDLLA